MKKITFLLVAAVFLAAGSFAFVGCKPAQDQSSGSQAKQYTCSMHPEVVQDKPGKCPKCGMDLVEKR
ncbi:MAG: hypothetical protein ABS95_00955 [Verrucomicrobia bacterium SCN 57-15]|nr:MAG: hypothetical protein ABS95_00955 [Verrucomicrobia bacterium SCN 57-15]